MSWPELVIRPAMAGDLPAMVRLHAEAWREGYRGLVDDGYLDGALVRDVAAFWGQALARPVPGRLVLMAMSPEGAAGSLTSMPEREDPGTDRLTALSVTPAAEGRGIGTALMREAAERLLAMGRRRAVLSVLPGNARARALYARLGGVEREHALVDLPGGGSTAGVTVVWEDLGTLATAARAAAAARAGAPETAAATTLPAVTGAPHPLPAARRAEARRKQRLGAVFGLTDFGVNLVTLPPGCWSSIPHAHSREEEFVLVLEGRATLVTDRGESEMAIGDCAGFPGGTGRAHHLENRTGAPVVYLEVGSRRADVDICDYPGEDLQAAPGPRAARLFRRRDGTPV